MFIDYNQNARDRTFASAYSVRKTPIATVSMPLSWDELRNADPDDYTMNTVPDLLAGRDDPWADIDSVQQSLGPLLDLVAADEERGLGDLPYPPNYRRCPANRHGYSPARRSPSTGTSRATASSEGRRQSHPSGAPMACRCSIVAARPRPMWSNMARSAISGCLVSSAAVTAS